MGKLIVLLMVLASFLFTTPVYAHEAYVLTRQQFLNGLQEVSSNPLEGLLNPEYLQTTITITIGVILSFIIAILWSSTDLSSKVDKVVKKARVAGPLIIRLAISASLFYAAQANSVLGPELSLSTVPYGFFIRPVLFLLALLILFGLFVEIAAFVGLLIFVYITCFYGTYMITYANYFGELVVLVLFGSRFFSFDRMFFGKITHFKKIESFRHLEVPIVRVLYGIALMYAGYTIKFLHQNLTVDVYNQYHLVNFFHANASFIASGAGVTEIAIGLFILLGFTMRWTVMISLVFITLSILYFREMLWPHFMLYGISFSLIINSADEFTVDRCLVPWVRNLRRKYFN